MYRIPIAPKAKVPLPRYPAWGIKPGKVILTNVSKPHIEMRRFGNNTVRWICANHAAYHQATTPKFAYNGWARKVQSKRRLEKGL